MARRHNHYEAAFEDYVRSKGWPYVPVDEHRRAIFGGGRVKSFDFLVYAPAGPAWLVDIKGRKFPYETGGCRRFWENWTTQADLDGLRRWEGVFGPGFEPMLVFAYWLTGVVTQEPSDDIHAYRGRCYAFAFASATKYAELARDRSPKWGTVSVSRPAFRELISASRSTAALSGV